MNRPTSEKAKKAQQTSDIWNKIFRNDSTWLDEMVELRELKPAMVPTLVGNLRCEKDLYLVLLVHDWSGELRYAEGALIESLRRFKYISGTEIYMLDSRITVNIAECLGKSLKMGQVNVKDPRKLFARINRQLYTCAIYFGDNNIHDIGPDKIGGIRLRIERGQGLRAVRDICSIKLKSADGKPMVRILVREKATVRLENLTSYDENGRQWISHWKEMKLGWREW
ncbi:hypothetical protein HIM_12481 [Hirsutella minnesotensis 3608]|uniref:Uncharacterized protein n=1 Tax=Hirsutella minnesotensis 3608 TaxID=1043627 RepID=A0A0F7ZEX0_9HYPO|nr:hypothetical protein HIM_12481 [Hirsutella minnesotensis 3608]